MQKSELPEGIRTLRKWYTTKTLRFDLPTQREEGQWSPLQKYKEGDDRIIKMVGSYDAKKLCKEYSEKYPIDFKYVEEWIEYMKS